MVSGPRIQAFQSRIGFLGEQPGFSSEKPGFSIYKLKNLEVFRFKIRKTKFLCREFRSLNRESIYMQVSQLRNLVSLFPNKTTWIIFYCLIYWYYYLHLLAWAIYW